MATFDFLVVGSGIAGASVAASLAAKASVALVERETAHGYHTTGRSAALYAASYGNEAIRAITRASRAFFDNPPEGFAAHPILSPRGCLYIARQDQLASLQALCDGSLASGVPVERIGEAEARGFCPVLRPGYVVQAGYEPTAMDIDVDALHQGYLRQVRTLGGDIRLEAELVGLERVGGAWTARLANGETLTAKVVIDAAGAWADIVGAMAGARRIGLAPLRRTALVVDPPAGITVDRWPFVIDVDETFYFKPEAGKLLVSPADETPSPPCDAQPEELDLALAIDRVQAAADLPVRRILRSWAGLRSFVADRSPVVGFDADAPGFFWLAAQGGYGIQTAPALSLLAAALARGEHVPPELEAAGVTAAAVAPDRPALSP
jgi:D-arginine dehydrogenase